MVRFYAYSVLTIVLLSIDDSESARILAVFPAPSISHQAVFRPITHELAKKHEVVVITPDPFFTNGSAPENLTEIDVHDISYKICRENLLQMPNGNKKYLVDQMSLLVNMFSRVFEEQLKSDGVQKLIKDKTRKFDLILAEACVKPAITFSHLYKAPVILVSSLGTVFDNNHVISVPNHPIKFPMIRQRLYNLTIWEKFKELNYYWKMQTAISKQEEHDNVLYKKYFGPDMPTLTELSNNVQMLFVNLYQVWSGNYPVPPSVVFMGGLHQNPSKDLPKDLEASLNSSKHGVIYFSLGTNSGPLSTEQLQIFVNVFSKLPYDIYWIYYHEVKLPELSDNIKVYKFLPQADLLRHEKIKLFITQGGLQSTDEAISAAVPLVGLPMLADQWYNVEQYMYFKIGVGLDISNLNEKDLTEAIEHVIGDNSYRENIKKLRTLMHDQPQKPLQRALWWIEHILRHGGGQHLRSPVANISLTEFIELDLVIVMIVTFSSIISTIVAVSFLLWQYVKKHFSAHIKEKNF